MKLWNEAKKLFKIWIILGLIVFSVLYYFMAMDSNARHTNNGHGLIVQMAKEYGEFLDEDEYNEFVAREDEFIKKADRFVLTNKTCREKGITTGKQYLETMSGSWNKENWSFLEYYRLQQEAQKSGIYIVEYYDALYAYKIDRLDENWCDFFEEISTETRNQCAYIVAKNPKPIMNDILLDEIVRYLPYLVKLVALCCSMLIMGLVPLDRHQKIFQMQYTTKKGRHIIKNQRRAIMLFVGAVGLFLYGLGFWWFAYHHDLNVLYTHLINTGIVSFYWYDLTLGQFCLIHSLISIMVIMICIRFVYFITNIECSVQTSFILVFLFWMVFNHGINLLYSINLLMIGKPIMRPEIIALFVFWILSYLILYLQQRYLFRKDI